MTSTESPLRTLDELASGVTVAAAPLEFRNAHSADELEMVHRLRYRVCVDQGWADPEEFPDGLERDVYDDGAVQITAWDDHVLVGTCRVVLPSPDRPLPVEAAFDLVVEPRGQVADLGRLIVAEAYRGSEQHWVWLGLIGGAWLEIRAHGFSDCAGVASEPIIDLYRRMGIEVVALGPAQLNWGEQRRPIRIDVERTAESLSRRVPKLLEEVAAAARQRG